MTAIARGFYNGAMIEPGAVFEFDYKPGMRLPRWAVQEGSPLPAPPKPFGKPSLTLDQVQRHTDDCTDLGLYEGKPPDAQLAQHLRDGTRPTAPVRSR